MSPPNSSSRHLPLLVLIGTLSICTFLVGLALDLTQIKMIVKVIPALTLAVWVLLAEAEKKIALGLVFGALGDWCLSLPGAFLPGMIAFAIGHGLYVWVFWQWQPRVHWLLALPIAAYLTLALTLMLPGTGELTVPVVLYMSIIGAMIWRAAAVADSSDHSGDASPGRWLALGGALLFGFSDTLIGINRFALPLPGVAYPIILTYWGGQFLIAASAVQRRSSP